MAIKLVAQLDFLDMPEEKRIDLMHEILSYNEIEYDENLTDPVYSNEVISVIEERYRGVRNQFIAAVITKRLQLAYSITIEGIPDDLYACPCCQYKTLTSRGDYDICDMCSWEDDGNDDLMHYSGPNHMLLKEGRANFLKYGSMYPSSKTVKLAFSGIDKYAKESY
ncbi:CPCC family cysteine-rich protein [Cytophagaceae bacterium DM2B3-1]|uniref:CPCC family cysteine-rich protein n=1 Tax=Xanthocytophaga flava TaxID=3048013 RepID=A0ABT7CDS4_9BACT|nr:CPCC family cysteine-rich protein [Xanthocytophaga flavus]MDJ1491823.1 CPCC family cysteine-rich protein [Xanthocytophaga flavus]